MAEIVDNFIETRFKGATGNPATPGNITDLKKFAQDLGSFLYALHKLSTEDGVKPSFENSFIGSDLPMFTAEFDEVLLKNRKLVPSEFLHDKIDKASKKAWDKEPVWIHGNLLPRNLLVDQKGHLANIIGAEKAVIGDPAWDLAVAWLLFERRTRKIFFAAAGADEATIDRARVLALRNGLNLYNSDDIDELIQSRDSLTEILKDYGYSGGVDSYDSGISANEADVDYQPGGLFGK